MNWREVWATIKGTGQEWGEDQLSRLAAALAYYTVFALPPLFVIAIAVAGFVIGRQNAQDRIIAQVQQLVGQAGAQAVAAMIQGARNRSSGLLATILSAILLLFSAAGVFVQLQGAFNTVWDVPPGAKGGFLKTLLTRLEAVTMVIGVGFLLLISMLISAALSAAGTFAAEYLPASGLLMQVADYLISFAVIAALFALIFRYLPDTDVQWRDVWPGAAITALLFILGQLGIGLYLGHSAVSSTYGAAGSLAVILLWVYYSAQILLLGAEFTQVYAKHLGSRQGKESRSQADL
jgi:membrane protein